MGTNGLLRSRKLHYVILVFLLAIGVLLSVLSEIPMERKNTGSTDIPANEFLLPGYNKTYDLEEVNSDNHLYLSISQVKEQRTGRASEVGLHYYLYCDSEPTVNRYENWVGVNSTADRQYVNITEQGHWHLFVMNHGNASLSFRLDLEWIWYSDVPILPGRYLTFGILIIIYSVLFISIIAMRDRFKKKGKGWVDDKTEKGREKSNTE